MKKRKLFRIGDVVQIKSGGPAMTVERVGRFDNRLAAICTWATDGRAVSHMFFFESLELV